MESWRKREGRNWMLNGKLKRAVGDDRKAVRRKRGKTAPERKYEEKLKAKL